MTRNEYENSLNDLCPDYDSDEWIIGGQDRRSYYPDYGTAIRRFDPVAFNAGHQEATREEEFQNQPGTAARWEVS